MTLLGSDRALGAVGAKGGHAKDQYGKERTPSFSRPQGNG